MAEGTSSGRTGRPGCRCCRAPIATKISENEIFGPEPCVMRADSDDTLAIVDGNPYGNGTAIFARGGGAARAFERDVTAGMVGIDVPIPVPVAYHSFGGWKDSLFGDTHVDGPEGVCFYTRYEAVSARWSQPTSTARSAVDLNFPGAGR